MKSILGGWEVDFCFVFLFCLYFQFNMCNIYFRFFLPFFRLFDLVFRNIVFFTKMCIVGVISYCNFVVKRRKICKKKMILFDDFAIYFLKLSNVYGCYHFVVQFLILQSQKCHLWSLFLYSLQLGLTCLETILEDLMNYLTVSVYLLFYCFLIYLLLMHISCF